MPRRSSEQNPGPLLGYLLAAVGAAALFWVASDLGASPKFNYLIVIGGGLTGWVIGILITPTSRGERAQFSEYGKAISAFVTGFVAAKIDKIFDLATKDGGGINEVFVGRLMLFASAFALGVLMTFIWRRYISVNL